ncbi:MAG: glycosyltransferase family 4 protein [bacterium]
MSSGPRIVTVSDHIDCPTGFGVQHRLVATALARAGFEVHSLGLWDDRPLAATPEGLVRYPGGRGAEDHRRAWAMYRELLRPDAVVTLGDAESFAHLNDAHRDFAWCHWLPLDAAPYPVRDHERMLRYDHLVLMSRFALALVRPRLEGRVPLHRIPHGVDTATFRPHERPLALRRRWAARLGVELSPDDFLLLSRDTNQWRKQTPLLLDALGRLPQEVKLLLHCRPVAHRAAHGWDLEHLARAVYGVADRVIFTGRGRRRPTLTRGELAELDNAADLRVSATQGEGFGVVTLEAMACGTPTVITDCTTSRELIAGRGPEPLDPYGDAGALVRVAAWTVEQSRSLRRPVANAADLAAKVEALRGDRSRRDRCAEAGLRRVLGAYTAERVGKQWVALVRSVLREA